MAGVRSVTASMAWTLRLSTRPSISTGRRCPRRVSTVSGWRKSQALSRAVSGQCSLARWNRRSWTMRPRPGRRPRQPSAPSAAGAAVGAVRDRVALVALPAWWLWRPWWPGSTWRPARRGPDARRRRRGRGAHRPHRVGTVGPRQTPSRRRAAEGRAAVRRSDEEDPMGSRASERAEALRRHADGKVALVTGAASGIGRALATELVDRGATVVAADIDGPRGGGGGRGPRAPGRRQRQGPVAVHPRRPRRHRRRRGGRAGEPDGPRARRHRPPLQQRRHRGRAAR